MVHKHGTGETDLSGEKFGEFVRREREAKELGLGVSPTYLSKVERDEFPPPAEGKVVATFRQPFDMLAETTKLGIQSVARVEAKSVKSDIWLTSQSLANLSRRGIPVIRKLTGNFADSRCSRRLLHSISEEIQGHMAKFPAQANREFENP